MAGIKALVIGMGALLVVGFVVVVVTLINRMSPDEAAGPLEATLPLAAGERLAGASLDGGRIAFRFDTAAGARVEVRDLGTGALISRFTLEREAE